MRTIYLVLCDDGLFIGLYGTIDMANFEADQHDANVIAIGIDDDGATVDIEGVLDHNQWHNDTDIPYCH